MQVLFDLIPLALQTDSTRLVTILLQGANSVPPVPGVTIDHHNCHITAATQPRSSSCD